jgi:hypothetical protein
MRIHVGFWSQSQKERGNWTGWEVSIKARLTGIGCDSVNWIDLAWDMEQSRAIVNTVIKYLVP